MAVLGTGVDPRHPDLAGSVTTGPDYTGSGRTAGGPFWGINGTAGRRGHRRARARHRPRGRPARRRARGEDPVYPGQPGVQRPAELRPGHRRAAARGHRQRHHLRGRPRRAGHRPAAGPRHGRPDRPGQPGRGRRQPGRAGGGGVRAAQERGAGGPGRRRRPGSGPDGLPGRLPRGHRGGRGRQERAGRPVQQQALVRVADRPGRRPDGRGPARRLRADQLHQHVQRHRGRRGRPHPVPVPAPHRGPGRPGADRGHDPARTSAPGAGHGIIDAAQAVGLATSISAAAEPSPPGRHGQPTASPSGCRPRRRTGRTPATWPARWSGTSWPACAC